LTDDAYVPGAKRLNIRIRNASWKACDLLGLYFGVAGSLSDLPEVTGFVDIVAETKRMSLRKFWGEIGTISISGASRNISGVLVKTEVFTAKEEYESLADKLAEE